MSKKILFFGNEKLATGIKTQAHVFRGLIEAGYEIKALIVSQKLDKHTEDLEVVKLARKNGIEVKSYSSLTQAVDEIAGFKVEAAVLAAYGRIVPKEVIDIFKVGIINIHPSLLPRHRGPTPIESAILNGDKETGVSIMKLAAEMDAGPVYKQSQVSLKGNESKQQLADILDDLGRDLLLDSLNDILDGRLQPTDQPTEGATYDKLISKDDGTLSWDKNWLEIDRKIRAYANWPKLRFSLGGLDITLLEAHHEHQSGEVGKTTKLNGSLAIYNLDGLVVIDRLIPAGAKEMSGHEFMLGYGSKIAN